MSVYMYVCVVAEKVLLCVRVAMKSSVGMFGLLAVDHSSPLHSIREQFVLLARAAGYSLCMYAVSAPQVRLQGHEGSSFSSLSSCYHAYIHAIHISWLQCSNAYRNAVIGRDVQVPAAMRSYTLPYPGGGQQSIGGCSYAEGNAVRRGRPDQIRLQGTSKGLALSPPPCCLLFI